MQVKNILAVKDSVVDSHGKCIFCSRKDLPLHPVRIVRELALQIVVCNICKVKHKCVKVFVDGLKITGFLARDISTKDLINIPLSGAEEGGHGEADG
jgi:hypothetical protein